jgi:hypothetical protein
LRRRDLAQRTRRCSSEPESALRRADVAGARARAISAGQDRPSSVGSSRRTLLLRSTRWCTRRRARAEHARSARPNRAERHRSEVPGVVAERGLRGDECLSRPELSTEPERLQRPPARIEPSDTAEANPVHVEPVVPHTDPVPRKGDQLLDEAGSARQIVTRVDDVGDGRRRLKRHQRTTPSRCTGRDGVQRPRNAGRQVQIVRRPTIAASSLIAPARHRELHRPRVGRAGRQC